MTPRIISVTGTKGKTTTVAIIDSVLRALGEKVLKVDTTGHFVNGERKSTLDDSKQIYGLVPSVAPGRYLYEFYEHPEKLEGGVAVLECSLGSSAPTMGLGYRYHKVGVFLNVFADHIGSSSRIKTREDIAHAKEFVFSRISQNENGTAVFNADDALVVDRLTVIPGEDTISLLPIGLTFSAFNNEEHIEKGGKAVTVQNDTELVLLSANETVLLCDFKQIPWTFNGSYIPSVWNIMSAAAAIIALNDGTVPDGFREALEAARLDPNGGRLVVMRARNGVTIIADYAHESESLAQIGALARSLTNGRGKTVGVVRLAHDRTDELIHQTGHVIAESFDEVVVYDKIDGYWRKPRDKKLAFKEVAGRTSQVLYDAIAEKNTDVTRIIREDEALIKAAEIAGPGDVVVAIVNDDIVQSMKFIREAFGAELV